MVHGVPVAGSLPAECFNVDLPVTNEQKEVSILYEVGKMQYLRAKTTYRFYGRLVATMNHSLGFFFFFLQTPNSYTPLQQTFHGYPMIQTSDEKTLVSLSFFCRP